MTLGDRPGPAADRSHRPGGTPAPPPTGAGTSGPGVPDGGDGGWPASPWAEPTAHPASTDRPSFGPHPPPAGPGAAPQPNPGRPATPRPGRPAEPAGAPRPGGPEPADTPRPSGAEPTAPHPDGPAGPTGEPVARPTDSPHLGAPPGPAGNGYAEADLDAGHAWYTDPPPYTSARRPADPYEQVAGGGGRTRREPVDPFGDGTARAGFVDAPDPPWSRPADTPREDRADDGYGQAAEPGPPPPDDEVLPPADGARRETDRTATVSALQPANIYRAAPAKAGPAGPAPSHANGAAVLCGLLAVPMLAAAGALAATGDLWLPVVLLAMAVCSVAGGIRMIRRGSPLLPLLCAVFAVVATVVGMLAKPLVPRPMGLVLGVVFVLYAGLVLIMIGLLRTRKTRRWLAARSREWQEKHPPRRRFRLPVTIELPRLRRPRRPRRSRKPKRVKQVGRHVRNRRRGPFRSRRPVSYVGRDAPDHDR